MPVVNIGTAQNLYTALKSSLSARGYNFSNVVAFMSDKNYNPHLYDVGCICHLANLTVKAGMETLPIDIDQLCWSLLESAWRIKVILSIM